MGFDVVTYNKSKKYTDTSIEGTTGPLAGKNCQIASIEDIIDEGKIIGKRVTYTWYKDGETVARTSTMDVMNGEDGADGEKGDPGEKGEPGDPGFSPEITVEEATANTYKLKITTEEGDIVTPNLKGGGEGVDVDVSDESLVFTY